jgi:hypothetical protein
MKAIWCFVIFLIALTACATHPIPTTTLPTAIPTVPPSATFTPIPSRTNTPPPTLTQTPTPTSTPIAIDRNPRALLIEADVISPTTSRDAHVPLFRLYADGYVIFAGERTTLATGLDATVRTGRLSENEIQNLLALLNHTEFTNLKAYYEPRPKPANAPTAQISVYLNKAKTVRVYAPDDPSTPAAFSDAFKKIAQSIPVDYGTFTPVDAFWESTDAGAASSIVGKESLVDWSISGVKLVDAINGITVAGRTYEQIIGLRAGKSENQLYREGDRAYRIRFVPNLPRAVHLTDWLGTILNAPREFDGRTFEIVGYYRGWNLLGEASGTPNTRNDWTIADDSGAMYVTGLAPAGLNASSREDIWNVVRLTARVVYVRLGTSYLEARRVENLTPKPSATPTPVSATESAIALVKSKFPELAHIKSSPPFSIGASTNITVVYPRIDAIYLVFWEGSGDCPAGCINNRYYYFMVKDNVVTKMGEYSRIYNEAKNNFETTGAPLWGVPKQ